MGVVIVDAGEEAFLDLVLAVNYTLRLYRNNVTSGLTEEQIDALAVGAFTEANFAGYSAAAMTGGSWVSTQGNPSIGQYAQQTFTRSSTGAAQLIYGYYVTLTSGGALRWFEQFPAPISVEFISDAIRVTPRVTLDDVEGNDVEAGTIVMTGRAAAPTGWLLCDGTAVSRTTYVDLFTAVGTAFGVGDGSTTFNLPDLRQRFPLGKATSGTGATLGGTGGNVDHVHGLDTATSHAKARIAATSVAARQKTVSAYNITINGTGVSGSADASSLSVGMELGGSSGTGNPPFQAVNFKIKT